MSKDTTGRRSFWNTCQKKLDAYPTEVCDLGKLACKKGSCGGGCEWFINDEGAFYCFWRWLRDNTEGDGSLEPPLQGKINKLLRINSTINNEAFQRALEKGKLVPGLKDILTQFKP